MKKIIIVCLSLLFLTTIITACGENSVQKPTGSFAAPSSSAKPSKIQPTDSALPSTSTIVSVDTSNSSTTDNSVSTIGGGSAVHIPTTGSADENASMNVRLLVMQISSIETITSENYKTKLPVIEEAENMYNSLTSAEQAQVVNYSALVMARGAINTFLADGIVNDFNTSYALLESKNGIYTEADVELVASLKNQYENLSAEALAKIDNAPSKKTVIDNAFQTLKTQGLMEKTLILDNISSLAESTYFVFSSACEMDSNGQDKLEVDGQFPTKVAKLDQGDTITFTTYTPGTLVLYCYRKDQISIMGEPLATINDSFGDDYATHTFVLNTPREYTLTMGEGELFVYAIKFIVG